MGVTAATSHTSVHWHEFVLGEHWLMGVQLSRVAQLPAPRVQTCTDERVGVLQYALRALWAE